MSSIHIVVIGAGAFGGWTALFLRRLGYRVTLIDAWGPGNSRASSGDKTRIIRSIYGNDITSVRMAARSLALWKEHQQRWQTQLYIQSGAIFLAPKDDPYIAACIAALAAEEVAFEKLSASEASRRYPQFNMAGREASLERVDSVLVEPEAGILFARQNCRTVVEHFVEEGGEYRMAEGRPSTPLNGRLAVHLQTGETLRADSYVFACGPWLGQLFPELLANLIRPTRQEVLYIGTPSGSTCFDASEFPCWVDRTSALTFYGIPETPGCSFKMASDARGPIFDPDAGDRIIASADSSTWREAQAYVGHRLPALANSPLLEARVCQYENSPDVAFIIDRHPEAQNAWLVGGGSGHGYKHGPAVGELVAALISGAQPPPAEFSLARFNRESARPRRTSTI